jgi:hypothetical protein
MTSLIIVVVFMACAGWMAWSRWTYWRTPIRPQPSAERSPQTRAFEAFTHWNSCLAAGRPADAAAALERARALDPNRPYVAEWLADMARRQHASSAPGCQERERKPQPSMDIGPEQTPGPRPGLVGRADAYQAPGLRQAHRGQASPMALTRMRHPAVSPMLRQGSGRCLWSIEPLHHSPCDWRGRSHMLCLWRGDAVPTFHPQPPGLRPHHVEDDPGGEVLGRFTNQYGSSALSEQLGRRRVMR